MHGPAQQFQCWNAKMMKLHFKILLGTSMLYFDAEIHPYKSCKQEANLDKTHSFSFEIDSTDPP